MKIGIVLSTSYEGSLGVVVRVTDLIRSLVEFKDVEVHVFSPFDLSELSKIQGVFFHHLDNTLSKFGISEFAYDTMRYFLKCPFIARNLVLKNGFLSRVISSLSNAIYSSVKEYDLDLLQGEQEIAALSCLRLGQKLDIPLIASLHNIWPEELAATGIISRSDAEFSCLMNLEQEIVSNSDMVIVLSTGMKNYLLQNFTEVNSKIVVIPLGSRPRLGEVMYVSHPFRVVHAGLLSWLDNPQLFVQSMPHIIKNYPDVEFHLTKRGEALKFVKKLAKRLRVDPEFFWYNEKENFFNFLNGCHIGIVTSRNHITRKFGFTMKFFDYLSSGIPVVANDIGGWTEVIEEEKIGILTDSNSNSFANGVLELLTNPDHRYDLSRKCLRLAKTKFNIDNIAKSLKKEYLRLLC